MTKDDYLISCFHRPVTNKTEQYLLTWPQLYGQLTCRPRELPEYTPEAKAKFGDYYVRGVIRNGESFPERNDQNLVACSLTILDIDHPLDTDTPLPTPAEIHSALSSKNISHVVHTSANPQRCRVVLPCRAYKKEAIEHLTWAAYCLLRELGLVFAFSTESRVASQPWFLPQTSVPSRHVALGSLAGIKFTPSLLTSPPPPLTLTSVDIPTKNKEHLSLPATPTAAWVIDQIKNHSTLHQAAKRYAGWLVKTTDWTLGQIFDEITGLVNAAGVEEFIERWPAERKKFEAWFEQQGFSSTTEEPEIFKNLTDEQCLDFFKEECALSDEYLAGLGKEQWACMNLAIERQITIIIAKPGGGKTSFMINIGAPTMVAAGYAVTYFDLDSPPSDHKMMAAAAKNGRFALSVPNAKPGKSVKTVLNGFNMLIDRKIDLSKQVFILDTLKKFVDMMSKRELKDFFAKMKQITALGATIVLLGHANKHNTVDGLMVFEGTGDVLADCDNLIFFAAEHNDNITKVSTIVDQNLGAKVRGIFKSFTFQIDKESRAVTFPENATPVEYPVTRIAAATAVRETVAADGVILNKAVQFLKTYPEKNINLDTLAAAAMAGLTIGVNRVKTLIRTNTALDGMEMGLGLFTYEIGEKNAKVYHLTEKGQVFEPAKTFD